MSTSSDDDERRRQYLQGYADSVDRHRNSASTYESRANEFATNAIKALTYLNGGGLVAIPTVVALFGADPKLAKFELLKAAIFFVLGLFAVVVTQASAYVVFARRAEAEFSGGSTSHYASAQTLPWHGRRAIETTHRRRDERPAID
jgi:hypothetical protein